MTRVLLVEDSPTQAEELKLILESEGFEIETAPDGEAGLRKLEGAPFDLVVSDILMPGMSGYELCRAVKSTRETRDLPVILLTTLSNPMDVIQGLESGADNFVTKPYEPTYLVERVKAILENRRMRAENRLRVGIDVLFLGKKFTITSDKQQILDLLICTFEDTVRKNRELEGSQAKLAATLAQLEIAHKELEAFSYSVSHDLRAPLRGIDGFSQALLEEYAGRLDERGQGYLGRIRHAAKRMAELIDDLLALSFVTRAELRRENVSFTRIARAVAADLRLASPERAIDIAIQEDVVCLGDRRLLTVVLENLVGNAWKFTGKVEDARVELGAHDEPGGRIYWVRDNGAGFDDRYAAKLFVPFQRLHSADAFPGTGIGLAIVRRVIDRHGGRVWAEGRPDGGATFYFTLPRT
jgi:signal transduction histidine kinase